MRIIYMLRDMYEPVLLTPLNIDNIFRFQVIMTYIGAKSQLYGEVFK